jgi:hypothetical protein
MTGRACEFQPYGVMAHSMGGFRNAYPNMKGTSEEWLMGTFLTWGGYSEHAYALIEIKGGYVIEVETSHFRFIQ